VVNRVRIRALEVAQDSAVRRVIQDMVQRLRIRALEVA
jgi:hypothetical protein